MLSNDAFTASLPELEEPSCCSFLQQQDGPTDLPTLDVDSRTIHNAWEDLE